MSVQRLREHPIWRHIWRYTVAFGATVLTIALLIPLRFLIEPLPSPPFLLAVMVVAWLAGFGPAVVSVVLSALALDYWFIPPIGAITTTPHEVASVASFAVVGIGVAWLTATRRQAEDDRKALLAREQSARASAEAADRARDEFVAVLGHEFRNPLSAIVSAVGLLDRIDPQEERTRPARASSVARRGTSRASSRTCSRSIASRPGTSGSTCSRSSSPTRCVAVSPRSRDARRVTASRSRPRRSG